MSASTSFVGSSRAMRLGSPSSSSRSCRRRFSPPDSSPNPRGQVFAGEAEPFQQLRRRQVLAVDREGRPRSRQHLAHPVTADLGELGELLVQHPQPERSCRA
jgi:hypothetical protein